MYQFWNVVFADSFAGKEVEAISLGFLGTSFNGIGIQWDHFPKSPSSRSTQVTEPSFLANMPDEQRGRPSESQQRGCSH
jgi:hypothetical protein